MTDIRESGGGFELRVFFRPDSLANWEAARPVFEELLGAGGDLAPTRFWEQYDRSVPISAEVVERRVRKRRVPDSLFFTNEQGVSVEWAGFGPGNDPGSKLWFTIPVEMLASPGFAERLLSLASAVCGVCPPAYGWAHLEEDVRLGSDPHRTNPFATKQVTEAYWLLILGAPMLKKLKHADLATTPAHRVEFLADGSALIVTTPDPADLLSPDARAAQAAVLAHLRPDLDRDSVLRELVERSAKLEPVEDAGDPDLAVVFRAILEAVPLSERRDRQVELKKRPVHPSEEWRPAAEALPADVEDVDNEVDRYHRAAQTYVAGFHDRIPNLIESERDALPFIDAHCFLQGDSSQDRGKTQAKMVPTLGAYLGVALERELGGRWVPRQRLEESQVIVGDRAWLPFLRVSHSLRSRDDALAHSLTRFFREAERHAGKPGV
jgi:hypothetical protein